MEPVIHFVYSLCVHYVTSIQQLTCVSPLVHQLLSSISQFWTLPINDGSPKLCELYYYNIVTNLHILFTVIKPEGKSIVVAIVDTDNICQRSIITHVSES
jgi:hypothetical protein